jgi:hypothetical protein
MLYISRNKNKSKKKAECIWRDGKKEESSLDQTGIFDAYASSPMYLETEQVGDRCS